ncbi:hypothetical protein [Streptomyces kronopolitis]|uniref:hypothetical protein n=1 Tax=Streptomyces kronopolitis TaxID=1612435 RepID=UPI00367F921F
MLRSRTRPRPPQVSHVRSESVSAASVRAVARSANSGEPVRDRDAQAAELHGESLDAVVNIEREQIAMEPFKEDGPSGPDGGRGPGSGY